MHAVVSASSYLKWAIDDQRDADAGRFSKTEQEVPVSFSCQENDKISNLKSVPEVKATFRQQTLPASVSFSIRTSSPMRIPAEGTQIFRPSSPIITNELRTARNNFGLPQGLARGILNPAQVRSFTPGAKGETRFRSPSVNLLRPHLDPVPIQIAPGSAISAPIQPRFATLSQIRANSPFRVRQN